jgi:hypothetical protein
MTERFAYRVADTGPALRLPWYTGDGGLRDLTGGTFTGELEGSDGTDRALTATMTGGNGYVDIQWAAADLDVPPDTYRLRVTATVGGRLYTWDPGDYPLIVVDA